MSLFDVIISLPCSEFFRICRTEFCMENFTTQTASKRLFQLVMCRWSHCGTVSVFMRLLHCYCTFPSVPREKVWNLRISNNPGESYLRFMNLMFVELCEWVSIFRCVRTDTWVSFEHFYTKPCEIPTDFFLRDYGCTFSISSPSFSVLVHKFFPPLLLLFSLWSISPRKKLAESDVLIDLIVFCLGGVTNSQWKKEVFYLYCIWPK